ncbi:MAG: hypothetical protein PSV22_05885 [Pseudolabrys sp.]|nr:hypothetical protein [Pseudolabrys sp.]
MLFFFLLFVLLLVAVVTAVLVIALAFRRRSEPSAQMVVFENYTLKTRIKLPKPVVTPLGSRASSLALTVDITYSVRQTDDAIALHDVRVARGAPIMDGGTPINASTSQGEGFSISPAAVPRTLMLNAVLAELESSDWLADGMRKKWRGHVTMGS